MILFRITLALFLALAISAARAATIEIAYTGQVVNWEVPTSGNYHIRAAGAAGGSGLTGIGGLGAIAEGDFTLNAGEILQIAVGGQGQSFDLGGGGGGGSFVSKVGAATPLIVAGGGGGGGYSINGSAGQSGLDGSGGGLGGGGIAGSDGGGGSGGIDGGHGKPRLVRAASSTRPAAKELIFDRQERRGQNCRRRFLRPTSWPKPAIAPRRKPLAAVPMCFVACHSGRGRRLAVRRVSGLGRLFLPAGIYGPRKAWRRTVRL